MTLNNDELKITEQSLSAFIDHLVDALNILREKNDSALQERILEYENRLIKSRKLIRKIRLKIISK